MAFFEHRMDERISYGARGGPVWSTAVVKTQSGMRYVNKNWQYPLHKYDIGQAVKNNADFEAVRALFYVVAGQFDGFRFKDFADFELTHANSRLVAQVGSPSVWQIARVYSIGGREFVRPISKPVQAAGLTVRRNRSGTLSTATASVDYSTGLVTIAGHVSGDTYTCVGEFDVPVAFADDAMSAEIVDTGGDEFLMRWGSIMLEEIRLTA